MPDETVSAGVEAPRSRGWWSSAPEVSESTLAARRTVPAIRAWLIDAVARRAGLSPDQISTVSAISAHGLDSRAAISISGDLGEWLGRELSPTLVWDYPTIEAVAGYLADPDGARPEGSLR